MIFPEAGVIRDLWHKRNAGQSEDVNVEYCMQNTNEIMFKNNFCLPKISLAFLPLTQHLPIIHSVFYFNRKKNKKQNYSDLAAILLASDKNSRKPRLCLATKMQAMGLHIQDPQITWMYYLRKFYIDVPDKMREIPVL